MARARWEMFREGCEVFLAREQPNWPGWLAVALGLGIAIYFALPTEPALWLGPALALGAVAFAILVRRSAVLLVPAAGLIAATIGFSVAELRTAQIAAPQLQDAIRFAHVQGRVAAIEPFPNAIRATLDHVAIAELKPEATPVRIQVKISKGADQVEIGDRVELLARLQPPSPPMAPGAFDFRRQSFFQRLGATGFALGAPQITLAAAPTPAERLWMGIDRLRLAIGRRISALEPGPAGALTRALTVGDQTALAKGDTDAMRISGLAHLLSISGLHIGMAAGLFFIGLRTLLALVPRVALRYPIKKWSAAAAILAAGFYALLAGASVPTERSLVMVGVVFLAVLLDRSPFSFRTVAWAAIIVLLGQPESLVGASFQLSFFAVLGLIAAFEAFRLRLAAFRGERSDPTDWFGRLMDRLRGAAFWLGTSVFTSVVATLMTAPFALYHFDRLSTYGVLANMIAIPLTGFWVMPMGMAALLLMPFGLDAPFWHAMARGCDGILWIAHTVAAWPYSVVVTPAMPPGALVALALGLVALCLMRSRWRLVGLAPLSIALLLPLTVRTPDLLVSGDAKLIAIKDAAGYYRLNSLRASQFAAETWLRRNGQIEPVRFPAPGDDPGPDGFACDALGCVYQRFGRIIAVATNGDALSEDCARADLVISTVPIRGSCASPVSTIDRFDLWRGGTYAVIIATDGALHLESVAGSLGDRPWVLDRMREGIRAGKLVGDPAESGDAEDPAADDGGTGEVD